MQRLWSKTQSSIYFYDKLSASYNQITHFVNINRINFKINWLRKTIINVTTQTRTSFVLHAEK